jgi:DNA-binding Lrp family transcriptional regulator
MNAVQELTEERQNQVMRAIQHGVPFVPRPFAEIGAASGLSEAQVLELARKWSDQGVLREISAILEGSNLGYESALVAGTVSAAALERTVEIVNEHPTVTHNYLRDHNYNLWFTIAAPLEPGLDAHIAALTRMTGVAFRPLRRTATFKIGVNFDPRTLENRTESVDLPRLEPVELTEESRRLFRALQTPAPLVERPFAELAGPWDTEEATLIEFGRRHLGCAIRRYVGTLRHRKLGVRANVMVVWRVPADRLPSVGPRLAGAPEVSHCYARHGIEGFPYTLYSMIHGPDLGSCRAVAARLSDTLGVDDYRLLVSLEEYKKTRLRYFLPELDRWWAAHGTARAARRDQD